MYTPALWVYCGDAISLHTAKKVQRHSRCKFIKWSSIQMHDGSPAGLPLRRLDCIHTMDAIQRRTGDTRVQLSIVWTLVHFSADPGCPTASPLGTLILRLSAISPLYGKLCFQPEMRLSGVGFVSSAYAGPCRRALPPTGYTAGNRRYMDAGASP